MKYRNQAALLTILFFSTHTNFVNPVSQQKDDKQAFKSVKQEHDSVWMCNIRSVTTHYNSCFRNSTIKVGRKNPLKAVFIPSLLCLIPEGESDQSVKRNLKVSLFICSEKNDQQFLFQRQTYTIGIIQSFNLRPDFNSALILISKQASNLTLTLSGWYISYHTAETSSH